MLNTKYQGSRPYGFRQEDFSMFFPIKAYVKCVIPGAGPFLAQGQNLNNLGGPLVFVCLVLIDTSTLVGH